MSGLRVTRLAVQDVGVLRGRVDLGSFDPEITLITGANETGKSTAVEALRCALFEKHNAGHAGIRALQPHGTNLPPQVWVDFTVGGRRYELHKQFLKGAMVELRIDDTEALVGAEADEAVWACLGSSRPGTRGAKREDMGIWGLLWVSQDEAAAADPGTKIGEETRGALQDVIGRQVGQIVGGRHGERIRTRAREEARRYWTPTLERPTGELAEARERRERAAARVDALLAAKQDVEDEAGRFRGLQVEIEELLSIRPALEGEVEGATARAEAATQLERAAEGARERLATAEARLGEADGALRARRELVELVKAAETRLAATAVELEALGQTRGERAAETAAAVTSSEQAASVSEQAERTLEEATGALARGRRAVEAAELAGKLSLARELVEQLAALEERERTALDDALYRQLAERDDRRREIAARLEGELPQAGPALTGDESLDDARERRRERLLLEVEREEIDGALAEQAPGGIEALAEATAEGRATLGRDEAALESAEALAGKLAGLRAGLASNPVDEGTLTRVTERAQRVEVARARCEAIGTSVVLEALRDLPVTRDGGEPLTLSAGETTAWTLDRPSRVRLGEVAELTISPGGEEVAEAGARLEAAEGALAEGLGSLGLDSLDAVREQGTAWAETRGRIRDAEVALAEQAPAGLDALRAAVEAARGEQVALDRRLAEAREQADRRRQIDEAMDANPVTATVLTHIEELARVGAELERGLAEAGVETLDEATERWKSGLTVAEQIAGARKRLEEVAPGGTAALESAATTAEGEPEADGEVDLEALERAEAEARGRAGEARTGAETRRRAAEVAKERRAAFEAEVIAKEATRSNQEGEVERGRARLDTARAETPDADLETRRDELAEAVDEVAEEARVTEEARAAAAPELLEGDPQRARETLDDSLAREQQLRLELARVEALLNRAAEEGRFELLGDAEAELEAASDALIRVERAAAGARRLAEEVERAYAEAQRRFLAPVVKEARPYLSAIRPGTEIRMTEDLTVAKVLRRGTEEDFDQLSGGTREQLSVIVRLALARVLARDEDAEPLPLILDDTMGWTDEPRFVEMVRILRDASKQFQLIVLTCHPSRFARLQPGRTIELDALRREAREAESGDPA